MVIELTNLGISQTVGDYKLAKELDGNRIKRTIDTVVGFHGDDYGLLLEQTLTGKGLDQATVTEQCGADDITISCNILHNEGKIKHRSCIYEKKVFIKDPLTCLKDLEVNIFDYSAKTIGSLQGTLEKYRHVASKLKWIAPDTNPELDEVITYLGGVPDPIPSYSIESIIILATVTTMTTLDERPEISISYEKYAGHKCQIIVTYSRIIDTTQHSAEWIEVIGTPGTYYFSLLNAGIWHAPKYELISTNIIMVIENEPDPDIFSFDTVYYLAAAFTFGQDQIDKDISNAVDFLELMEGIFECTGLVLTSNFFGINPDASEPDNEVYAYATTNMQQLKILQSYDIIREVAIQDSFANSGKLKAKKFLEELSKMFNLVLLIDTVANVLRLEHISYFNTKGLDFTTNSEDYGIGDVMEVNKELIGAETWRMAAQTPNGYQTKIVYDVIGDVVEEEYQIEQIITDVAGTINNVEYEKDEYKKLFYLVQTDGDNIIGLNTGMYIDNVVKRFHYINRVLPKGIHDGNPVSFSGYSLGITTDLEYQGSIKDFVKLNPCNSVKTRNGVFMITKMEFSKDIIKMEIRK